MSNYFRKEKREILKVIIYSGLILFSVLAAVKMIILGLNIDEEYAVTMAYRMANGDRMFLEMWEPHQTSGFVCALFIKLYLTLFQSKEYLVLFLRGVGVLLQALVSLFVYTTLKRRYSFDIAFMASLISFNVLPKWILVPEFSNLLLWCSLCTWMCLLRYAWNIEKGAKWLALGAVFYCGMVLAYPTCCIVLPIYLFGLYRLTPSAYRIKVWILPVCCVLIGVLYVAYFLSHMSIGEFGFGLQQMLADGEHSYSLPERLSFYGNELKTWILPLLWVFLPALVAGLIGGKAVFGSTLILLACIQQWCIWLGPELRLNRPLLFFYIVYGVGAICVKKEPSLFWLGYIPAGVTLFAVLLLTNTTIGVSGVQLLPGMLCACILLLQGNKRLGRLSCLVLLALFMFAKGWLVSETEGYKADAFFVKQKALYGPAKNVYCRYVDGYAYNALDRLLEGKVTKEDSLLYVGNHSLRYLLTDAKISTYSTISTPTFDERLLTYWDKYPDRYPTIILVEKGRKDWDNIRTYFQQTEIAWETEDIEIYITERYRGNVQQKD